MVERLVFQITFNTGINVSRTLLELVQWTSNVDVTIIQGDERQRLMTIRSVWWEYYTELLMCVRRECSFRPLTHIIWLIVSAKFVFIPMFLQIKPVGDPRRGGGDVVEGEGCC